MELSEGYTKEDVKALEKVFEAKLAEGRERINFLVKIDGLSLAASEFSALVEDMRYALKHIDQLRHIAVVGDSKLEELMIKLDNKVFGRPGRELIENYFDVADIDQAWAFVRS